MHRYRSRQCSVYLDYMVCLLSSKPHHPCSPVCRIERLFFHARLRPLLVRLVHDRQPMSSHSKNHRWLHVFHFEVQSFVRRILLSRPMRGSKRYEIWGKRDRYKIRRFLKRISMIRHNRQTTIITLRSMACPKPCQKLRRSIGNSRLQH